MESETSLLVQGYSLENISFSKPKKYSEYYVSKVRYTAENEVEDLVIQFPKMAISSFEEKSLSAEFMNMRGYNKEIYNFLSEMDSYIMDSVSKSTEEWFGKQIPLRSIKKMYNSFIKPPRTTEGKCTLHFGIKYQKNELKTLFLDRKDNEVSYSQFKEGEIVECIAHCKYIFFSKDTCFPVWELISSKIHKKIQKVQPYGFIEDPTEQVVKEESDDEELEMDNNSNFF
jgi:hypothetical protein